MGETHELSVKGILVHRATLGSDSISLPQRLISEVGIKTDLLQRSIMQTIAIISITVSPTLNTYSVCREKRVTSSKHFLCVGLMLKAF